MSLETLARYLFFGGVVLIVLSGVVYFAARSGLPLGRLPGDIVFKRGNVTLAFPIVTSILISVVLTILLNLLLRWWNR